MEMCYTMMQEQGRIHGVVSRLLLGRGSNTIAASSATKSSPAKSSQVQPSPAMSSHVQSCQVQSSLLRFRQVQSGPVMSSQVLSSPFKFFQVQSSRVKSSQIHCKDIFSFDYIKTSQASIAYRKGFPFLFFLHLLTSYLFKGLWSEVHHKRGRSGQKVFLEEHGSQRGEWSCPSRHHYCPL